MLSEDEIQLVQESYAKIYENGDSFSQLFYKNLFQIAPDLSRLFSSNIETQGRKFMEILSIVVLDLQDEDLIIPLIQEMGRRHVGYGTEKEHYEIVGRALVKTLEESLSSGFTEKEKAIWVRLYGLIANIMITAAENPSN